MASGQVSSAPPPGLADVRELRRGVGRCRPEPGVSCWPGRQLTAGAPVPA
jgi:hypothetical protein